MYYIIFIAGFLSTMGFFNYHNMLSEAAVKALFYLISVGALMLAVTDRRVDYLRTGAPRMPYITLMTMLCASVVTAYLFHDQSITVSLMASLPYIFAYSWFYILIKFNIPADRVIKFLFAVCAMAIPVYALNALSFPNAVFGEAPEEDLTRGIIRIILPFIHTFALLLFFSISKWNSTKRPVWIAAICILSLMLILSVIRQIILMAALLSMWYIFKNLSLTKKIIGALTVVAAVVLVLPNIPMYESIMELSEKQYESNQQVDEDVRIGAWRHYVYEYQDSPVTVLLGNGIPSTGHSAWGDRFDYDSETSKYFAADVGWAGFLYHFGLIATVALAVMMLDAFRRKKPESRKYLNYWLIFMAVIGIASGPILYFYQIIEVVTGLYLVYAPYNDDEEDCTDNTQLQQC